MTQGDESKAAKALGMSVADYRKSLEVVVPEVDEDVEDNDPQPDE